MPKTMEEVNRSCINEQVMREMCRSLRCSGKFVDYRPDSDNPYAGLYYVCGDEHKVNELADNWNYFGDSSHVDPAWVARREQRNPDYFYTDAYALNVSSLSDFVAIKKISDYAKQREAVITIFSEYGIDVPKKITKTQLTAINKLNQSRFNLDYTPDLRKRYGWQLEQYLNKNFSKKKKQKKESNWVGLDHFMAYGDDVRFIGLEEDVWQYLKKTIESDPIKYGDIKIYVGKLETLDLDVPKTGLGEYNPWRNMKTHYTERKICYRNCDEDVIAGILNSLTIQEVKNSVSLAEITEKSCLKTTIPVEALVYWDTVAQREGFKYHIDRENTYGDGKIDHVTIIYRESDDDKVSTFYNAVMSDALKHSKYLGVGQSLSAQILSAQSDNKSVPTHRYTDDAR